MATANYDHPSFLTRQFMDAFVTTAGNGAVSGGVAFPWDVRIRNAIATVRTAGTATGNQVQILTIGTSYTLTATGTTTNTGTTTVGSIVLGTQAAYATGTSGDLNCRIQQGCVVALKNGTDATGVAYVGIDAYLDPATASWIA
jgi:hypothetical protein